jgi:predicted DNA-binding protein
MAKRDLKNEKVKHQSAEQLKEWMAGTFLATAATSRESDKFILRLPDGMRERLAEVAENQGRTMNAVVIGALAEYLTGAKSAESQLAGIEKAIQALTDKVAQQSQTISQLVKERADEQHAPSLNLSAHSRKKL